MTILRIEVCQICETIGKPTSKYRIGDTDHLVRLPLCADCVRTPFDQLLAARPRRRKLAPNVPVTMDQVRAAKKASPRRRKPRVVSRQG